MHDTDLKMKNTFLILTFVKPILIQNKMKRILLSVQTVDIEDKLNHAPNNAYQIGVTIGSFLPFVLLIGIAYWMYYTAKKEKNNP